MHYLFRARTSDPGTSHTAAALMDESAHQSTKDIIVGILMVHGPSTHSEIHAHYKGAGGRRTENRIRTATAELVREGRVQRSNVLGLSPAGNDSHKWEVAVS
jgi:hypothetical protein